MAIRKQLVQGLKCRECKHEWSASYHIFKVIKDDKSFIKRFEWKDVSKEKVKTIDIKCPICGSENIDFKEKPKKEIEIKVTNVKFKVKEL